MYYLLDTRKSVDYVGYFVCYTFVRQITLLQATRISSVRLYSAPATLFVPMYAVLLSTEYHILLASSRVDHSSRDALGRVYILFSLDLTPCS